MTKAMSYLKTPFKTLGLVSFMALAGCGPLISFGNDGPADEIYTLDAPDEFMPFSLQAPVIYLDEPSFSEGLGGLKVAVGLPENRRTTLQGVRWSANISDLLRDYLLRGLSNGTGAQLVGEGGLDIKAGCRMPVHVWSFEFRPGAQASADRVRMSIELSMVKLANGQLLGRQTFSKSVPVTSGEGPAVMAAFNRGLSDMLGDMTLWQKDLQNNCAQ